MKTSTTSDCPGSPALASAIQFLRSKIQQTDGALLPPTSSMAAECGVAVPTMRKAARILADRGLITVGQGRRFRIAGRQQAREARQERSSDRLYRMLRDSIRRGEYRSGEKLPKREWFMIQEGVSSHTVTAVYRRLSSDRMAHKRGRHYIVGTEETSGKGGKRGLPPVILILANRSRKWAWDCRDSRVEQFCAAFLDQAVRHGVRLMTGVSQGPDPRLSVPVPSGREQISRFVKQLGTRYRGTLITGQRHQLPDLEEWTLLLSRFGRPVVWFDRSDQGFGEAMHSGYRCHYSEERAVKAATDFLVAQGHRRAYYPFARPVPWQLRRRDHLDRLAAQCTPPLAVVSQPQPDWQVSQADLAGDMAGQLARFRQWNRKLADRQIGAVLAHFDAMDRDEQLRYAGKEPPWDPASKILALGRKLSDIQVFPGKAEFVHLTELLRLLPVLEDRSFTAIIAPNDYMARNYRYRLATIGVKIPQDMSLISFDNRYRDLLDSITSVDFGFGYLGYQAFHAIIQMVSVEADERGDIPAQPEIVDGGTVAPVRNTSAGPNPSR